jgi:hypothetical protein
VEKKNPSQNKGMVVADMARNCNKRQFVEDNWAGSPSCQFCHKDETISHLLFL